MVAWERKDSETRFLAPLILLVLSLLYSSFSVAAPPFYLASNAVQPGNRAGSIDYSARPPFSADEFWRRVLNLLNEHNGTVLKARFEEEFGIHFVQVDRADDATSYRLRKGKDWYFGATFIEFNDKFKAVDTSVKGAHVLWSLSWNANSFGDPAKGQCITAARVKEDLTATGWSSPWRSWGTSNPSPSKPSSDCGPSACFIGQTLPPALNFRRQSAEDVGDWSLPRGTLASTGNQPESCVTSIAVTANYLE